MPSQLIEFRTPVKQIMSKELVPGDIICIEPYQNQVLQCDAVLTECSCSVDESMLTGESNPITKVRSLLIHRRRWCRFITDSFPCRSPSRTKMSRSITTNTTDTSCSVVLSCFRVGASRAKLTSKPSWSEPVIQIQSFNHSLIH